MSGGGYWCLDSLPPFRIALKGRSLLGKHDENTDHHLLELWAVAVCSTLVDGHVDFRYPIPWPFIESWELHIDNVHYILPLLSFSAKIVADCLALVWDPENTWVTRYLNLPRQPPLPGLLNCQKTARKSLMYSPDTPAQILVERLWAVLESIPTQVPKRASSVSTKSPGSPDIRYLDVSMHITGQPHLWSW